MAGIVCDDDHNVMAMNTDLLACIIWTLVRESNYNFCQNVKHYVFVFYLKLDQNTPLHEWLPFLQHTSSGGFMCCKIKITKSKYGMN